VHVCTGEVQGAQLCFGKVRPHRTCSLIPENSFQIHGPWSRRNDLTVDRYPRILSVRNNKHIQSRRKVNILYPSLLGRIVIVYNGLRCLGRSFLLTRSDKPSENKRQCKPVTYQETPLVDHSTVPSTNLPHLLSSQRSLSGHRYWTTGHHPPETSIKRKIPRMPHPSIFSVNHLCEEPANPPAQQNHTEQLHTVPSGPISASASMAVVEVVLFSLPPLRQRRVLHYSDS